MNTKNPFRKVKKFAAGFTMEQNDSAADFPHNQNEHNEKNELDPLFDPLPADPVNPKPAVSHSIEAKEQKSKAQDVSKSDFDHLKKMSNKNTAVILGKLLASYRDADQSSGRGAIEEEFFKLSEFNESQTPEFTKGQGLMSFGQFKEQSNGEFESYDFRAIDEKNASSVKKAHMISKNLHGLMDKIKNFRLKVS